MHAYYYDNLPTDQRLPHDCVPSQPVSGDQLAALGVKFCSIPIEGHEKELDRICAQGGYTHRDILIASKEVLGEEVYAATLKTLFEEHIHEKDEVRYYLAGGGYYDVRETPSDAWIRLPIDAGDLIAVPSGIYHRLTLDERDEAKVLRLFKDDPELIPLRRGEDTEIHPNRIGYLEKFGLEH